MSKRANHKTAALNYALILASTLAVSCGGSGGSDEEEAVAQSGDQQQAPTAEAPAAETAPSLVENLDLTAATVTAQVEDVVASMLEAQDDTEGLALTDSEGLGLVDAPETANAEADGLALTHPFFGHFPFPSFPFGTIPFGNLPFGNFPSGRSPFAKIQHKRSCVENEDDSATVQLYSGLDRRSSFGNSCRDQGLVETKKLLEKNTVWTDAEGKVFCLPNRKDVKLRLAELEGLTARIKLKREKVRRVSYVNKRKGTSYQTSYEYLLNGTRKIVWDSVVKKGTTLTINKSIGKSTTLKVTTVDKEGKTTVLESNAATADTTPLKVEVIHTGGSQRMKSYTILGGTLVSATKAGHRVETTFDNVKYTSKSKCDAVSGKIKGAIFTTDDYTPALTYVVDFAADVEDPMIQFSDGRSVEFVFNGCAFEDPSIGEEVDNIANIKAGR